MQTLYQHFLFSKERHNIILKSALNLGGEIEDVKEQKKIEEENIVNIKEQNSRGCARRKYIEDVSEKIEHVQ